jgi:hypothetical protein
VPDTLSDGNRVGFEARRWKPPSELGEARRGFRRDIGPFLYWSKCIRILEDVFENLESFGIEELL